jgi:hypothetical protein
MTQQRHVLESAPKAFFIHDVHRRTKRDFVSVGDPTSARNRYRISASALQSPEVATRIRNGRIA